MNSTEIYVLLSIVVNKGKYETIREWGDRIGVGIAIINRSVKSLIKSKLVLETPIKNKNSKSSPYVPFYSNVEKFLLNGFPFVFPAEKGKVVRGVLTGIDASSLKSSFVDDDYPSVWPHHEGTVKGYKVDPLHKSIPGLVIEEKLEDDLYEMLALLDVLRTGKKREVDAAEKKLREIIKNYAK